MHCKDYYTEPFVRRIMDELAEYFADCAEDTNCLVDREEALKRGLEWVDRVTNDDGSYPTMNEVAKAAERYVEFGEV